MYIIAIMKSELRYLEADSREESDCGKSLEISLSSRLLGWEGIILEQGSSPHFYPKDAVTPYFYFALGQEQDLHWQVLKDKKMTKLVTHPDQIWFNPPYTPFTHNIDEPCWFIILAIEKEKMYRALDRQVDSGRIELLNNYNIVDPMLKGMIEMFYLEVQGGGRNGSSFVDSILKPLADYFFRNYSNLEDLENRDASPKSRLSEEDLGKLDSFFNENMGESFSLDQPASLVNMSLFHFLREFKKSRGITPHQYLLKMKVEKAKELLKNSDLAIQHIAYDLGFSDQSHFSRTFKKAVGTSPKAYRS